MSELDTSPAGTSPAGTIPSPNQPANPGSQVQGLRVVVEAGADPLLQKWLDDFMADPEEDPQLALDHGFPPEPVTAVQVYDLLNTFIEPKGGRRSKSKPLSGGKPEPYGPDNLPLPYAQSVWKPAEATQRITGGQPSNGGPKHNAKHRRLGMFHR